MHKKAGLKAAQFTTTHKIIGIAVAIALGLMLFGGNVVAGTTVKKGDNIAVDYVGTLEDGTLFDTSVESRAISAGLVQPGREYSPLEFEVGAGQMIAGFDSAVVGMKVNETKKVTLSPEQAYGPVNSQLVIPVPLDKLSSSGLKNVTVGMKLAVNGMPAKVTAVSNGTATIDMNHELAGKTLVFEITVRKIG